MNNPVPLIELIQQRLERGDVELPVFDGVAMEVHRETHENRLDADGLCQIRHSGYRSAAHGQLQFLLRLWGSA